MSTHISNVRPKPDKVLVDITDYALGYKIKSADAYRTARLCLMDTLGCGLEALSYPACTKLMGPIVAGTVVPNGARIPGTSFQLDPVTAAFNIGCMIRWLDFHRVQQEPGPAAEPADRGSLFATGAETGSALSVG